MSATVVVHVNDSPDEVEDLVIRFLDDFANYAVSPEDCVRSFSDSCAGKDAELDDVRENRRTRQVISGTYRVSEMLFNGEKTFAWVRAPCVFRSFLKDATGAVTTTLETATGTCLFEAVYEQWAWWLCDSKWQGSTSTGLRFAF